MDAPPEGSRLTPIRIGAALLVAGALSIGAAACGSGSSSDSTGSASVVNKEAGLFTKGVRFVVINRDPEPIKVNGKTLTEGQSIAVESNGTPSQADISFASGKLVRAQGANPDVGEPSITLESVYGSTKDSYVEGGVRKFTWQGVDWVGSRPADDYFKNLVLEVGKRSA